MLSMMAHSPARATGTRKTSSANLILLIVWRPTIPPGQHRSGSIYALSQHLEQDAKLKEKSIHGSTVSSCPKAPCRRRLRICPDALQDTEISGSRSGKRQGSDCGTSLATRDEEAIERPSSFIIDRATAAQHLSFCSGIHAASGIRLAERI